MILNFKNWARALGVCLLAACGSGSDARNLVDTAGATPNLTVLSEAVNAANFDDPWGL